MVIQKRVIIFKRMQVVCVLIGMVPAPGDEHDADIIRFSTPIADILLFTARRPCSC